MPAGEVGGKKDPQLKLKQVGVLVDGEPGTHWEHLESRLNVHWHLRALLLLGQDKFQPVEGPMILPVEQGQLQMFCDAVSAGTKHTISRRSQSVTY